MPMVYIQKGPANTGNSALFGRQDISPVITLQAGRPRPVLQGSEQVRATNTTHSWREQGRNTVFTGATTFAEGGTPAANHKAPTAYSNVTCRMGILAQVTDTQKKVFRGGGMWSIDDGVVQKRIAEQLDIEKELAALDLLDDMEIMHVLGNSVNTQAFTGGQTDGLVTWITASGVVMTSAINAAFTGTTSVPIALQEGFVKDVARVSAQAYPTTLADTMLVPPELKADVNTFVGGGAGRPIVQQVKDGPNGTSGLVGGSDVSYYNTGYSVVKVETEPALSPNYVGNSLLPQLGVILYNKAAVKQANLGEMIAEDLARTGASEQSMITVEFAQEHHVPLHAAYIPNVKSAVA